MNDWLRARNGWTLLLLNWAILLTGGLLGYGLSRTFSDYTASLVHSVPWLLGALCSGPSSTPLLLYDVGDGTADGSRRPPIVPAEVTWRRPRRLGVVVTQYLGRTGLSHPVFTGLRRRRLGSLIGELADAWMASEEGRLHDRRGHERMRAAGAGPNHQLVFTDRVIATLVVLRFQLPHVAVAVLYGVDRSTITRAVHEIRPLLANRGFAVPGCPGLRLRTLADVFAYAAAEGVELRLDGTEVRVRRPRASKPGRRAFVSGKMRQNTKKATVVTDEQGRTLWAGAS